MLWMRWTEQQFFEARTLYLSGLNFKEIAKVIAKTPKQIKNKLGREGVRRSLAPKEYWSDEEVVQLRSLNNSSAMTNRTSAAVRNKRLRLRKKEEIS